MVANASTQIEIAERAVTPRADARAGEEKFATVSFWSDADDNITVSSLSTHGLLGFYDQEQPEVASVDQSNQQYSILALTDSSGNVSERYAYTAYGQPTFLNASATVQTSSAAGNRYTYTAREWDATLGLHHFRARWMSGLTGRFLTRDPIGFGGGANLYMYVNGHSLVATDPTGFYQANVQANAFIPYAWVTIGIDSWLKGDDREVSQSPLGLAKSRALQRAMVEMEKCIQDEPTIDKFSGISPSHLYTINYFGGNDNYIERLGSMVASISIKRTGPCDVKVDMAMHGLVPFLFAPGAPAIDWHLTYELHFQEIVGSGTILYGNFSGTHDGFPAYESYVQSKLIYSHDPRKTWETPFSLFPPEDHTANASFIFIDPKGKASCCECQTKL